MIGTTLRHYRIERALGEGGVMALGGWGDRAAEAAHRAGRAAYGGKVK